ncbi:MAG: DMT family transporter [Planctomycetota bacterium]
MSSNSPLDRTGLLHLAIVVLIGSTLFLAIRVAVSDAGGFAPFSLGATRCAVAAVLLGLWLAFRRRRAPANASRLTLGAALGVMASGAMLWGGANGLASLASRSVGSGTVALFFATQPMLVALLDAMLRRRLPRTREMLAIALGTGAVVVLTAPGAQAIPADAGVLASLVAAPVLLALSILTLRKYGGNLSGIQAALLQLGAGAATLGLMAYATGEQWTPPSALGWSMWTWLTLAGSVIAFPSFAIALQRLPTSVFMSHAWINPVLATLLGAAVAGEALTLGTGVAAAAVVAGIGLLIKPGDTGRPKAAAKRAPSRAFDRRAVGR